MFVARLSARRACSLMPSGVEDKAMNRTAPAFVLTAAITLFTATSPGRATVIVRGGVPAAEIVLPREPTEAESTAAKELTDHVLKISGAELPTVMVSAAELSGHIDACRQGNRIPILLGRTVRGRVEKNLRAVSELDDTFMLQVLPDRVHIAGPANGTLFGVYELLEQLGVRWFMPGELGTVIPSLETVDVAEQETVQAPSFRGRYFQMGATREWYRRMRGGGVPVFPSAHGLLGTRGVSFEEHPEYFALINGERKHRQHCVSNPDLLKLVVDATREWAKAHPDVHTVGMGPNDGAGFCECAECRKLDGGDFDPFSGEGSVTDRCVWFFNQVLKGIEDEYPDLKIGFYIYHNYMRPPVKVKPHPNVTGALAPIALCRAHGPRNPVCYEKQYYEWLAQEWCKVMDEVWERGYWSNLACPGFPFIIVHRLRDQLPMGKEVGLTGWRVETFANWASQMPSYYIAAKLMWNADADVDALMQDFYEKFFGPAARDMGRYFETMDTALRDADFHTGCSWDMPYYYPEDVRREARKSLARARSAAKRKGVYEERVRIVSGSFEMLEAFIAMLAARVEFDFVSAKAHLETMDGIAEKLMAYDPPMLVAGRFSTYTSYTRRFYRPCTEQGHARVTGDNELVATLDDEWGFLTDPLKVGEELGWWRSDMTGGNWQPLKTSSMSWSSQGLRYYKGLSWYRQSVDVPAKAKGKRLFLWCGGVDEKAKVWINGTLVGISHRAAFYPFEMDITEAIRPGERNTIVFCVVNDVVNELGTGGIVAPVFVYAPGAGEDAELDNFRPLGDTFP